MGRAAVALKPGSVALATGLLMCIVSASAVAQERRALSLHPDNGHYFLFRGKPTVLVASGEHYGALLNLDFDYKPYFRELESKGLNLTRTFSGVYREVPGSFNIQNNTLAPKPDKYVCPWGGSDQPGTRQGGNKYDLAKWNEAYFARLKDFVAEAGKRGVVVELVLFCTFYEDVLWDICPLNAKNNVNNVGHVKREEAHTLKEKALVDAQTALVRKVVAELKDFDNVYYEVCNEPYFAGVADDWQRLIARTVVEAEKDFPAERKHLVARNIANGSTKIDNPDPNVSVFNFHYCHPPDAVGQNYHLNRVISYDETGFRGQGDTVYRVHAWEFLLAGGGAFDHLDYSFTPDAEDGSAPVKPPTPGGGGATYRSQLQQLKKFMDGMEFVKMKPDREVVRSAPKGVTVRALSEPGRQYGLYLSRVVAEKGSDGKETGKHSDPTPGQPVKLALKLRPGNYRAEWVDTRTGQQTAFVLSGGDVEVISPNFTEDLALRFNLSDR